MITKSRVKEQDANKQLASPRFRDLSRPGAASCRPALFAKSLSSKSL